MPLAESARFPPRRIAIVGGGVSGIACSWKLRNHDCDVDIYESDDRLGGHANSVPFEGNGQSVNVDTGFVILDEPTYPQFTTFLREIGVKTIPTDMSFGVSVNNGAFEWGSYSVSSFIGKLSYLFSPWLWRLMFDIIRFSLFAKDVLTEEEPDAAGQIRYIDVLEKINDSTDMLGQVLLVDRLESIGDYLKRKKYSAQFITYFLIPMVAAPWCIDPDEFARTFPAKPLIQFMNDHRMLETVTSSLRYRSFKNGSKTYVDAFRSKLPPRHGLHLSTPVQKVIRSQGGATLEFADRPPQIYDHVILATHANQALSLLADGATGLERKILGSFKTSRNICYLHSDTSLLPKRPSARVAWNLFLENGDNQKVDNAALQKYIPEKPGTKISITFDMNKLQAIPLPGDPGSPGRVLVTMNPIRAPRSPQSSQIYHHPLISSESVTMARHIHKINGIANISFAGAWMGFGFHEDGFAAGAHVAQILIDGWEKAGPMDLLAPANGRVVKKIGFVESVVRIVVSGVHQLLVL